MLVKGATGFKGFGKDSHKTVRESFMCWDLVRLILETWQYMHFPGKYSGYQYKLETYTFKITATFPWGQRVDADETTIGWKFLLVFLLVVWQKFQHFWGFKWTNDMLDDLNMLRRKGRNGVLLANSLGATISEPEHLAPVTSVRNVFDETWIFRTATTGYSSG